MNNLPVVKVFAALKVRNVLKIAQIVCHAMVVAATAKFVQLDIVVQMMACLSVFHVLLTTAEAADSVFQGYVWKMVDVALLAYLKGVVVFAAQMDTNAKIVLGVKSVFHEVLPLAV